MSETTPNRFKLPVLAEGQEPLPTRKNLSRRRFLQALGATSVATLAAGCTRPEYDTLAPYVTPPDDVVPGIPLRYLTSMSLGGIATGLMVTAYEGRPTKIEGNPQHPWNLGGTSVWNQASVLGLYDPSRARDIMRKGVGTSREALFAGLRDKAAELDAKKNGGAGLHLLLEPSSSPLLGEQLARLKQRWPQATVRFYSPFASDAPVQGANTALGKPLHARYDFKKADVIVSLDSDFLAWNADSRYAFDFADRRTEVEHLSRVYALECDTTLTGSCADHRLPMKSQDVAASARALYAKISGQGDATAPAGLGQKALDAIAKDLQAHRGTSLVLAGDRMPAAVHAIAHALNALLGNVGQTVSYTASPLLDPQIGPASLQALANDAKNGAVQFLIMNAWDPAFARPSDIDVEGMLAQVPSAVYSSLHLDQTAPHCEWFVPQSHFLETWGDARAGDGTVTIVQPLIQPLWNSLSIEELLSGLLDPAPFSSHDLIRGRYARLSNGAPDAWEQLLKRGFVDNTALPTETATVNAGAVAAAARTLTAAQPGQIELNLRPDYKVYDGRFGHNPWLLELPDPVTKLCWDNAVLMGPQMAKRLGVQREFVVKVTANGKSMNLPVYVVPGHADEAVTLPLGWGIPDALAVAVDHDPVDLGTRQDSIGFDGYPFTTVAAPYFIAGAQVAYTDDRYPLAITQTDAGGDGLIATRGGAFEEHGRFVAMPLDVGGKTHEEIDQQLEQLDELRHEKLPTMYDPVKYDGYKWSLSVDLSRCTGCSACVIACVAENNIPMVGKDGVRRGREMHWLRIDRYYDNVEAASPRIYNEPMMCQHCEDAPCEYVCPVNATTHSDEGLNEMVYNRCIGTRYCSNNCPYKVRRFNFFAYNNDVPSLEQMQKNPDVTVRSRGVMEKCTYCVQRIEQARIHTEINGLPTIRVAGTKAPTDPALAERAARVPMLQTACQQACPTGAIVFGNLNDPDSVARKLHEGERRFDVLNALGTRPRTGYLARIFNRNPELA